MSGLKRFTPLKRNSPLKRYQWNRTKRPKDRNWSKGQKFTTLGRGKKTKEWEDKVRPNLKVVFAAAGITTCELGIAGCWRDNALGFAHSLKRRNIPRNNKALLTEVALLCSVCHDKIERLPEAEMAVVIRGIIADRPAPVAAITW